MSTKEERAAKRKQLTGFGRAELLRLLLAAYVELDEVDDAMTMLSDRVCFSCLTTEHSECNHKRASIERAALSPSGEGHAHTPASERHDG